MNANDDPMHASKCAPSAKDAEDNEFHGTDNEDQGEEDFQLKSYFPEPTIVKIAEKEEVTDDNADSGEPDTKELLPHELRSKHNDFDELQDLAQDSTLMNCKIC